MKRLLWTMPVALMLALPGCSGSAEPPKKAPPPKPAHDHDHKDGDHDHDHDDKGKEIDKKKKDLKEDIKADIKAKIDDAPPVKDPFEKIEK